MSDLPLFLVKRLGAMIAIILVLTAIIFSLQKLSHADPVHSYLGANASKAAIAKESAILGYNKPVINQYFHYVAGLFHGDLQESLRTRRAVSCPAVSARSRAVDSAAAGWSAPASSVACSQGSCRTCSVASR